MRIHLSKKLRDQVKQMFGGHCAYCGQKPEKLCIDHVHPIIRAHHLEQGQNVNDISNLMPACFACNNYKMSMSLEQFRDELKVQVYRARQRSVNFRLAERFGLVQEIEKPITFLFEKEFEPTQTSGESRE